MHQGNGVISGPCSTRAQGSVMAYIKDITCTRKNRKKQKDRLAHLLDGNVDGSEEADIGAELGAHNVGVEVVEDRVADVALREEEKKRE